MAECRNAIRPTPLPQMTPLCSAPAWITELVLFVFCLAAIAGPEPRLVLVVTASVAVGVWYEARFRLFSRLRHARELIALMAMTPQGRVIDRGFRCATG